MRKRAIQIKLVKTNNQTNPEQTPLNEFETNAAIVAAEVGELAKKVMFGVSMYVVLDTCRRVVTTLVSK